MLNVSPSGLSSKRRKYVSPRTVHHAPVVALKTRLQRGAEYVWQAYEEVQNWWEPVNNIAHALLQQPERDEGVATEEQLQWTVERFDGVHHTPPRRWRA